MHAQIDIFGECLPENEVWAEGEDEWRGEKQKGRKVFFLFGNTSVAFCLWRSPDLGMVSVVVVVVVVVIVVVVVLLVGATFVLSDLCVIQKNL